MRVKKITPIGKHDVFNMEVDGTHDFTVGTGVVVHNCADEVRYMCMSRPVKPQVPDEAAPLLFDPLDQGKKKVRRWDEILS